MKKITLLIITCFFCISIFAQIPYTGGGGTGTAQDPYRIYTKEHLDEFDLYLYYGATFTGVYFELMNDITDTLQCIFGGSHQHTINSNYQEVFDGYFNGKGHNIVFAINANDYIHLFRILGGNAVLDSLSISGHIDHSRGFCHDNYGTIRNCINNLDSANIGICADNHGLIENCINNASLSGYYLAGISGDNKENAIVRNCINNGNFHLNLNNPAYNYNYLPIQSLCAGGISIRTFMNDENAFIENCINYGNFTITDNENKPVVIAGTICSANNANIINCQNYGNAGIRVSPVTIAGIATNISNSKILNCSNYGNLFNENNLVAGIICSCAGYSVIKNCFNSGKIRSVTNAAGIIIETNIDVFDTISFNLNVANIDNSAAIIANTNINATPINNPLNFNNYYDKQMCLAKGSNNSGDIEGIVEGKFTHQLVGTSPELQAMLGDGWSYAEGRYPIPLGLENDSIALVAATPIYLHYEDENNYNHIDSVSSNFTVGLENNVVWNASNNCVGFSNENAILLTSDVETIIANLGEFQKEIDINIILPCEISCNISGTVLDSENNPLADVVIACNNNGGSTVTSENGEYSFVANAIENTTLLVSASKAGYRFTPNDTTINVVTSDITNVNFVGTIEGGQVAIDENTVNTFSVFPNPSNGIVNISVNQINSKLEIYNIIGEKLMEETLTNYENIINISNLEKGIYIIKINNLSKNIIVN